MADDIVVLSDSDEDNGKSSWSRDSTPTLLNSGHEQKNQHGKRKRQQQNILDDEAPVPKRPTFYAEGSPKNVEQRANCGTPKLPQIVGVETLATPSATPPLQLLASPPRNTNTPKDQQPRPTIIDVDLPKGPKETPRRVKLTTVLKGSDHAWQELRQKRLQTSGSIDLQNSNESNTGDAPPVMDLTQPPAVRASETNAETKTENVKDKKSEDKVPSIAEANAATTPITEEKRPLEKEYEELLEVCRKADPSADMQKLIDTKLLKYYHGVHPDFVKSRGFRKIVCNCIERIRAEPKLVYYNLKAVVDELNTRRKSKDVIITNDEPSPNASSSNGVASTAPSINKHTEEQIRKLNKALYVLKKRIFRLEESDVDLNDENSSYLQVERYKKRACQIYEKICDLTGESKHARRLVKKPIQFSGTNYPAFNKTLQAYINRTKEFPDFFDVLRMMEHCNRQYDLKLANFETKRIAQDAFLKVGKILQSRRKTDLYETVSHFTANMDDPAKSDPDLLAKLNENQKTQTRISEVLEKYARAQDDPDALEHLKNQCKQNDAVELNKNCKDGDRVADEEEENNKLQNCSLVSEDDSDDEDDDDEALDEHVEKLTKDNTIDLSDDEVDMEISNEQTERDKEINVASKNKIEIQDNIDLKLTENNNIMRTKTNSEAETKTSAITENNATSKTMHITIASAAATVTTVVLNEQLNECLNATENDALTNDSLAASAAKITTPLKVATKDTKALRTIAEIVISDEE